MKIKNLILVFLTLPAFIFAQGGSTYTQYGLGDLNHSFSARRLAIGEFGAALSDYNNLNSLNPAAWSNLTLTRFEAGYQFRSTAISNKAVSARYNESSFSGFKFGFPLERDYGISLVIGLVPYSTVNYEVVKEDVNSNVAPDGVSRTFNGEGGLSRLFVGSSYKLPFDFSLGASFEYYTGKIDYNSAIRFVNQSNFVNTSFLNSYKYEGIGYSVGLISNDFADLMGMEKIDELRLGFAFSYVSDLKTDTSLSAATSIGTKFIESATVKTNLPYRFDAGLSFRFNKRFLFLFDYFYQNWSDYQFNSTASPFLQDQKIYSFGFEFSEPPDQFSTFWEQIMFRGGLSYEQTQYLINGQGINQYSVYAGFSVPLSIENSFDVGFQYGIRGTKENNLLKENIFKTTFSLSFGELWFVRKER